MGALVNADHTQCYKVFQPVADRTSVPSQMVDGIDIAGETMRHHKGRRIRFNERSPVLAQMRFLRVRVSPTSFLPSYRDRSAIVLYMYLEL